MGKRGQGNAQAALTPGNTRYPFIEGWVGTNACLDGRGKSRPTLGFDPRTVRLVASRYTDWAIQAGVKEY